MHSLKGLFQETPGANFPNSLVQSWEFFFCPVQNLRPQSLQPPECDEFTRAQVIQRVVVQILLFLSALVTLGKQPKP